MKDTLFSQLFLEEQSRKLHKNTNTDPHSFDGLDKTFRSLYPEFVEKYDEFMKNEKKYWGSNFGESFKKHSLFLFHLDLKN